MSDRRLLALGTLLLGLLHAGCGLLRTGPAVVADEPGYLFGARVLAGTGFGPLAGTSYYRGGWSLLLVPVELATSSPRAVFAAAVVVNAVLAAAVVPLVLAILRRHLGVPGRAAVVSALVAGCYPSLHVLSQAALPEVLLAVLVLVAALCLGELARGGGPGWAAGLGATLAYAYAVHGRSVALVGVGLVVLAALVVRRRVRAPAAVAALVVLAVGVGLAALMDRRLRDLGYDGSAADDVGERLRRLADGDGAAGTLRNLVGHTWYPAVASLGVLPLLLARWRDPDLRARLGVPAVVVGLTALGFMVLSAVFLSQPLRPDHLVYGRYVEAALPLLLGLGVAELIRRRPTVTEAVAAAAGVAVLTAVTVLVRVDTPQGPNRWNVASLPAAPTGELGVPVLLLAAAVAVVVLVVLVRVPVALLALAFLGVAAYGQLVPVRSAERQVYGAGWSAPSVPAGASVGVDPAMRDPFGRYAYPWFVPGEVAVTTDADYVFAERPQPGWTEVWRRGKVGLYLA